MKVPNIRLSDLLARTIEEGDCLVWIRHSRGGQYPQWRFGPDLWLVRRLVWTLIRGATRKGYQVGTTCGTTNCVHPDHLAERTRSQVQRGKPLPRATRMRIAETRRAQSTLLTPEIVQAIRSSDLPSNVLDRQYNLSDGYSSKLRLQTSWQDHRSPFAGLFTGLTG